MLKNHDDRYDSGFLAEQKFDIYLRGDTVTFLGRELKVKSHEPDVVDDLFFPIFASSLSGIFHEEGFIIGKLESTENGHFYLTRKENLQQVLPPEIKRGVVTQLASIDFPQYHYNIYIPDSFNPAKSSQLIIFDNPVGNASPLRPSIADEMGLISIGLVESRNSRSEADNELCNFAVILDLQRRLNINPERIIFAGFSGGGYRSTLRALGYSKNSQGVISIGTGSRGAAEAGLPVFYIMGEKDNNYSSGFIDFYRKIKSDPENKVELRLHTGRHVWNVPDLIDEAIRWVVTQ